MFSNKSKLSDQASAPSKPEFSTASIDARQSTADATTMKTGPKSRPSVLAPDLFVKGNLQSANDVSVEGQVEGDVRARVIVVGENATIRGKLVGEEIVVNGRVIGKILGLRVRLNSGARVEGDIVHETIAIEAGAHFEGSVKRKENPLSEKRPASDPDSPSQAVRGAAVAPKKQAR